MVHVLCCCASQHQGKPPEHGQNSIPCCNLEYPPRRSTYYRGLSVCNATELGWQRVRAQIDVLPLQTHVNVVVLQHRCAPLTVRNPQQHGWRNLGAHGIDQLSLRPFFFHSFSVSTLFRSSLPTPGQWQENEGVISLAAKGGETPNPPWCIPWLI